MLPLFGKKGHYVGCKFDQKKNLIWRMGKMNSPGGRLWFRSHTEKRGNKRPHLGLSALVLCAGPEQVFCRQRSQEEPPPLQPPHLPPGWFQDIPAFPSSMTPRQHPPLTSFRHQLSVWGVTPTTPGHLGPCRNPFSPPAGSAAVTDSAPSEA